MSNKKYVPSGGLAFTEEGEMKMLSKYAGKGWLLESFAPLGYRLIRGEPQKLIYSVDYQKDTDQDYFSFFEASQWTHVCSAGGEIHVFCAQAGTLPIYSDKATLIEKYKREQMSMGKIALPLLILTLLCFMTVFLVRNGWLPAAVETIGWIAGLILLVLLVFPGMPYMAYSIKLIRMRKH